MSSEGYCWGIKFTAAIIMIIILGLLLFVDFGCGMTPTGKAPSPWLNFWPHKEGCMWTYDRMVNGFLETVEKSFSPRIYIEPPPAYEEESVQLYFVIKPPLSYETQCYIKFTADGAYDHGSPVLTTEANKVLSYPILTGEAWGTSVTSECLGIVTVETALGTYDAYEILYGGMFHRYFVAGIGEVKRTLNLDPPHQEIIVDPEGKTYVTNTMETFAVTEEIKGKNF